jgi:hypothetical protein
MPVINTARELIHFDGTDRTLREWCNILHLNYLAVRMRYVRGERDADKLLRATPVPKKPVDTKKYAPKRQYLKDSTPPEFLVPMHLDDRRKILSYVGYDWTRLDTLLTKLLTEFVENELRYQMPDEPNEPEQPEGLDIAL